MQKLYHSISEVSSIIEEEQHILRYWEKEFEQLKPKKNRGGNRIYSDKDLQIIKMIKKYLRDDKLSLKGAKEQLIRYLTGQEEDNLFKFSLNSPVQSYVKSGQALVTDMPKGKILIDKSDLTEIYNVMKEMSYLLK